MVLITGVAVRVPNGGYVADDRHAIDGAVYKKLDVSIRRTDSHQ
jgi:hypothetical protein